MDREESRAMTGTPRPDPEHEAGQPDPEASSDGDRSWTDDPITADPDEDRSVDAVIERTDESRRDTGRGV
jgi:hypothetical protein